MNAPQFQIGDKVTPWDTWAEMMPAVPKMRRGRVYCVTGVKNTEYGPRMSFAGVRSDARGRVCFDAFWPVYAFRLVYRASEDTQRKEAA